MRIISFIKNYVKMEYVAVSSVKSSGECHHQKGKKYKYFKT